MIVRTRQEMAQLLNDRMQKTYASLLDEQDLEADTSLVKTYMVEAHLPEDSGHDEVRNLLDKAFVPGIAGKNVKIKIHETNDDSLFLAETLANKAGHQEKVILFIDCSNPRFWLFHSINSSIALDWLIGRLINSTRFIDSAWLSAEFLEKVASYGSFRGLGLDFDRRKVPDVDFETENAPVEFLKMQVWGNRAGAILNILRHNNGFPHATTLSKVKVKYHLDSNSNNAFTIDDVKFNGKITARGTSFQSHITLVSDIYRIYANSIRYIESKFSLSFQTDNGKLSIQGEPLNLLLNQPISDLDIFCNSIFSSSEPFRLWGVPIQLSRDYWRVSAIDLHVGARINFEIAPDFLRVYLPLGSCGNTIDRIYTNLQHYYDSQIEAKDGNGADIFKF